LRNHVSSAGRGRRRTPLSSRAVAGSPVRGSLPPRAHLAQMQLRFLLTAKYGSSPIDTRRTVVVSSTCPPWTARWRLRERTDCGQRCHRGHSGLHCAFRVPAPPLGTRLFHLELKRVGASWVPAQLLAALSKPTSSSSGILHKRARNCSSSSLDCIVIDAPVSRQSLASLMDMDFAVRRSLVRRSRRISDSCTSDSHVCLRLPSDLTSR